MTVDVLVIGAGVVGSATTYVYQTGGAGSVVNVSERLDQADTATVANGCFVAAAYRSPSFLSIARHALLGNMCFDPFPCVPRFADRSDRSAFAKLCADGARRLRAFLRAERLPVHPYVGAGGAPGFFVDGRHTVLDAPSFFVDGHAANQRLKAAAEKAGAVFVEDSIVGAERVGDRITRVVGKRRTYEPGHVVLCGGWRTGALARMLGVDLPVHALTGYSVSAPQREARPRGFADSRALNTFYSAPTFARVAGKYDFVGGAPSPRRRALRFAEMEGALSAAFPHVAGRSFDRWVGHRPVTADGLPVIGALPGLSNASVNTGHGAVGLTCCLAAAHALFGGAPPSAFSPARFGRSNG